MPASQHSSQRVRVESQKRTTPSACRPWTICTYASMLASLQRTIPIAAGVKPSRARWETGIIVAVAVASSFACSSGG